jgi:hypothetical protein
MLIRNQRRRMKRRNAMVNLLRRGARIPGEKKRSPKLVVPALPKKDKT